MNNFEFITVDGHTGLTGYAVVAVINSKRISNFLCLSHKELDLTDQSMVDFFKKRSKKMVKAKGQMVSELMDTSRKRTFCRQSSIELAQVLGTKYQRYLQNMVGMESHS